MFFLGGGCFVCILFTVLRGSILFQIIFVSLTVLLSGSKYLSCGLVDFRFFFFKVISLCCLQNFGFGPPTPLAFILLKAIYLGFIQVFFFFVTKMCYLASVSKNGHTLPPFICSLFSESPPFTFWTDKTVRLTPQAMRSGQTGQTVSRASRTMLALPEIDT